nr:unnamed protein product [Callosobruchus analis]
MNSRIKKILDLATNQILMEEFEEDSDDSHNDKDFIPYDESDSDSNLYASSRNKVLKVRKNLFFSLLSCDNVEISQERATNNLHTDAENAENVGSENEGILESVTIIGTNETHSTAEIEPRQIIRRPRTEESQRLNQKNNHSLRAPNCVCKTKKCMRNVDEGERKKIYSEFWEMKKQEQRIWLSQHVKEVQAKRKVEGSRRKFSRAYVMGEDGMPVCQKFFLSSIGYTSSTVIDFMLKASKDDHGDQRGRHAPVNKVMETPIRNHINSFNPKPSHYQRIHAPNRKYLLADLSIRQMYEDYLSNQNNKNVSYELYRRTVDKMNIGFYDVEADKCGFCIEMDKNPTEANLILKEKHLELVMKTRIKYRADAYAVDLQKVFLLPRMPKFSMRHLLRWQKITTFVSCGMKLAGRRAEDVACAFLKVLQINRDAHDIILWMDNCAGQNKNAIFFCALFMFMNSDYCEVNSVTINYLVSGHSYMAADGLHGKIEQAV